MKRIATITTLSLLLLQFACRSDLTSNTALQKFGTSLEEAITKNEVDAFSNLVGYPEFLSKFVQKGALTEREKEIFALELKRNRLFFEKIRNAVTLYGKIEFVKGLDENRVLLFKLGDVKDDFDYLKLEVKKVGDALKVVDGYFFSTGEWFSDELDRFRIIKDEEENNFFDEAYAIRSFRDKLAKGEILDALEMHQTVPDTIRLKRAFKIMHVLINAYLEEDLFNTSLKALDDGQVNDKLFILYTSIKRYTRLGECEKLELNIQEFVKEVGDREAFQERLDTCYTNT